MPKQPTQFAPRPLLLAAAAALCLCPAAAPTARAQRSTPNQTGTIDGRDYGSREQQIGSLERSKTKPRDPNQIMAEVNEDLARLKTLGENMTQFATAPQPLNYKAVAEGAAEVRRRSARLRANLLVLPPPDRNKKPDERKEFQPLLAALNERLDSFLHNPLFTDAGAPDPQLAVRAGNDLDNLISLGDRLRKEAERLSKTAARPQ